MRIISALYFVLALSLVSVISGPTAYAWDLDGSAWSSQAPLGQGVDSAQAGEAAGGPPIVGLAAQLTFLAFLVVMLVVPWIMARDSSDEDSTKAGRGLTGAVSESRFTSDRERRLWLMTLAVVVAIYSTLGPLAEVAAALRQRNLLGISSAAVLLAVLAIIALPWAKRRPGRREIGAAIGVAAVYLTTLIRLPVPEARSHLFEYGLVAMLVYQALSERRRNGRRVPVPAVIAFAATALLGLLDEGIQLFLPNRVYDLLDVGFNALAGLMAITASLFMAWARRWDVFHRWKALLVDPVPERESEADRD